MSTPFLNRPATSADVARVAGVSRAMVSYALHGRKSGVGMPDTTRSRILDAAASLGYRPNRAAQALKTGKTHTIALWSASFATPYYASVLGFVEQLARSDGYEVVVVSGASGMTHHQFDGAIVIDRRLEPGDYDRVSVPVVSMGAYFDRAVDHVGIDLYVGTVAALAHLQAQGKRRVAYLTWDGILPTNDDAQDPRLAAYRNSVGDGNATVIPIRGAGRTGAYHALQRFWEAASPQQRPDAFLCLNDVMAVGALFYLREQGVRVPDDVAVIGCDGIEESAFSAPTLTTLTQPVEAASRLTWQFLRARIADRDTPRQSAVLTPTLTVRESA